MRTRRPAAPFRPLQVVRVAHAGGRLIRITVGGEALDGFAIPAPAASVRLFVGAPGEPFEVPTWAGNEFLLADGRRAKEWIRTFTPVAHRPEARELDLDVVEHGDGAVGSWAAAVGPGAPAAVSGPARGYEPGTVPGPFLILGDESAIPAVRQVLAALPDGATAAVHLEAAVPEGVVDLLAPDGVDLRWHVARPEAPPGDELVRAAAGSALPDGVRVWAAGEAAAMQRIRRVLLDERGLTRGAAHVRGYWKFGRSSGDADEDEAV